jgi:predicted Zn finger-like uncharacterized protein
MAFEERTEQRACPTCGAQHRLHWYRIPFRETFVVKCLACGAVIQAGKGLFDCHDVRLVNDS